MLHLQLVIITNVLINRICLQLEICLSLYIFIYQLAKENRCKIIEDMLLSYCGMELYENPYLKPWVWTVSVIFVCAVPKMYLNDGLCLRRVWYRQDYSVLHFSVMSEILSRSLSFFDTRVVMWLCVAIGTRIGPAGQRRSKPRELRVRWSDPDQGSAGWLSAKTGAKRPGTGTTHRLADKSLLIVWNRSIIMMINTFESLMCSRYSSLSLLDFIVSN